VTMFEDPKYDVLGVYPCQAWEVSHTLQISLSMAFAYAKRVKKWLLIFKTLIYKKSRKLI